MKKSYSGCVGFRTRATVVVPDAIEIELLCDDLILPLAALRFLLESAGATAIEDTFA